MIRQAHASLDVSSRRKKAEKIARLLQLDSFPSPTRILEVGCGSGVISNYFALYPNVKCDVYAVDVIDQRVERGNYNFQLVANSILPFENESFDVVISNHVIEHVGGRVEQLGHLSEIRRVMRSSARAYLAFPNRWMVKEPHYQLFFLSWLPVSLRSPYLRISGRGCHYDCQPLSSNELFNLAASAGLCPVSLVLSALEDVVKNEGGENLVAKMLLSLPTFFLRRIQVFSPTLIYLLHKDL